MNAQCTTCGNTLSISEASLGERGARVRCPRCGNTVVVERPQAQAPLELDLGAMGQPGRPAAYDQRAADPGGLTHQPLDLDAPDPVPDELGFVDADLLGDVPPTRVQAAPDLGRTAVSARPAGAGLDRAFDASWDAAPTAVAAHIPGLDGGDHDDALQLSGGLSADGTFIPPSLPTQQASAPAPSESSSSLPGRSSSLSVESRHLPAPTVVAEPKKRRSALGVIAAVVGSLVAAAVLAFGLLVFLGGGRLDEKVLHLDHDALLALVSAHPPVVLDGVQVTSLRSFTYPSHTGEPLLVFVGEARNGASAPRKRLRVTAELRDSGGRLVASESAPLGASLGPLELHDAPDPAALASLIRTKAEAGAYAALAPGAAAPFVVVLAKPPPQLDRLRHGVTLAYDPPEVAPAPATPAPAADPTPRPRTKAKKAARGR
jgi:predicted Zn finger-like uncharacterized protein